MKTIAAIAVLVLAALAGCGGDGPGSGGGEPAVLPVAEAASGDHEGPAVVEGYLVAPGGEVRLCEALAESYPPQCGVASIVVAGLDPATVEGVTEAEGVSWTDQPIEVEGTLSGGVLTVSGNAVE